MELVHALIFVFCAVIISYRLYLARHFRKEKLAGIYQYELKNNLWISFALLAVNSAFIVYFITLSIHMSNAWPSGIQAGLVSVLFFVALPYCYYVWNKWHVPRFPIEKLKITKHKLWLKKRFEDNILIDLNKEYHLHTRVLNRIGNEFYKECDLKLIGIFSQNNSVIPFVVSLDGLNDSRKKQNKLDVIFYDGGYTKYASNQKIGLGDTLTLFAWVFMASFLYYFSQSLILSLGAPTVLFTILSIVNDEKNALYEECPKVFHEWINKNLSHQPRLSLSDKKVFELLKEFNTIGWQPDQFDLNHMENKL